MPRLLRMCEQLRGWLLIRIGVWLVFGENQLPFLAKVSWGYVWVEDFEMENFGYFKWMFGSKRYYLFSFLI